MIGDPRRAEGKLYQLPDWSGIATPSDCAYGPGESDILGLPLPLSKPNGEPAAVSRLIGVRLSFRPLSRHRM
jgi:hypothetical protein